MTRKECIEKRPDYQNIISYLGDEIAKSICNRKLLLIGVGTSGQRLTVDIFRYLETKRIGPDVIMMNVNTIKKEVQNEEKIKNKLKRYLSTHDLYFVDDAIWSGTHKSIVETYLHKLGYQRNLKSVVIIDAINGADIFYMRIK